MRSTKISNCNELIQSNPRCRYRRVKRVNDIDDYHSKFEVVAVYIASSIHIQAVYKHFAFEILFGNAMSLIWRMAKKSSLHLSICQLILFKSSEEWKRRCLTPYQRLRKRTRFLPQLTETIQVEITKATNRWLSIEVNLAQFWIQMFINCNVEYFRIVASG